MTSDYPDLYSARHLVGAAREHVVGMNREAEMIAAALETGRHLVLEGPPGTGKSTLLRAISRAAGVELHFVEGNAELTPSRLVGYHDPALVIQAGYQPDAFVPGPLVQALQSGGLLYLEELNRIPEESLNVLITALAEGEIHVPRVGRIEAHRAFRLVAAMNPADSIGTTRIAQAVYDRMCRVAVNYQDEQHECEIVQAATGVPSTDPLAVLGVLMVRGSRAHRDLRSGSSVRGAIDFAFLAQSLMNLRTNGTKLMPSVHRPVLLDAATTALSGRIRIDEGTDRKTEDVVIELLDAAIQEWTRRQTVQTPEAQESDTGKGNGSGPQPQGSGGRGRILSGEEARTAITDAGRRTSSRAELTQSANFNKISPEVGELDAAAVKEMYADDPDAALSALGAAANATDRSLRAAARALALRLILRTARDAKEPVSGVSRMRAVLGDPLGELDVDATLHRTDGLLPTSKDDMVTRRWSSGQRAICLLVDRSGSMTGHQVAMAAMGAAAVLLVASEGARQRTDVSVIAFNKDSIVLQHSGQPRPLADTVNDLLTLRGRGETDMSLALQAARRELDRAPARERFVILLSDAKHTAGKLPELATKGIDRVHVIGTSTDAESQSRGRAIAAAGGGSYVCITSIAELPIALNALLA